MSKDSSRYIDSSSINFNSGNKNRNRSDHICDQEIKNICYQEIKHYNSNEQIQTHKHKQIKTSDNTLIIYDQDNPHLKIELVPLSENIILQEELEENRRKNKELKFIQEEMVALKDLMGMMCNLVYGQGEKLEVVEASTSNTAVNVEKAAINIKEAHVELKKYKKKKAVMVVGAIGGGVLGGILLGGIGMLTGGILPAIIATGVGVGVGSGVGLGVSSGVGSGISR